MSIVIPGNEVLRIIARDTLRKNFPLYDSSHTVRVNGLGPFKDWLGYRTVDGKAMDTMNTTHFDLNFYWPNVCYLTYIEVEKSQRGKGLGDKLYDSIEQIAKRLGCTRLCQIPSGVIVVNGEFVETREDYLVRKRGYKKIEHGQVEKRL